MGLLDFIAYVFFGHEEEREKVYHKKQQRWKRGSYEDHRRDIATETKKVERKEAPVHDFYRHKRELQETPDSLAKKYARLRQLTKFVPINSNCDSLDWITDRLMDEIRGLNTNPERSDILSQPELADYIGRLFDQKDKENLVERRQIIQCVVKDLRSNFAACIGEKILELSGSNGQEKYTYINEVGNEYLRKMNL